MRLFSFVSLLLLSFPVFADFKSSSTPTLPDGSRISIDLPASQHMRNTGGIDRFGRPGMGYGLCCFTSVEMAENRWQNGVLAGFQKWMTYRPGGGDPRKVQQMITAFCKEKGVKEPDYVQHTGSDMAFLETAVKTRRMACVTYSGLDNFYSGPIDHMLNLHWLDDKYAIIQDNNQPQRWTVMSRKEFETRWKARGGGWAIVFLNSPPPPLATTLQFKGLDYPTTNVTLREELPEPTLQQRSCPGGRCPTVVVPSEQPTFTPYFVPQPAATAPSTPTFVATQSFVDRSDSSVLVTRNIDSSRSEMGTGTVVAARTGESMVLTNAHVVEDATKPITVTTKTGKVHKAKYVAGSKVTYLSSDSITVDGPDLALISVEAELPVVPIAFDNPADGTSVCIWGYGKTAEGKPTHKTGKTLNPQNYVGAIQLTSIPSQNGDSGSGVFNESGSLVAVGWGGSSGTQFCVRLDAVREFLTPHLKGIGELAKIEATAPPAEPEVENHGINKTELDELTKNGKRTYWINGREVGRPQALDAVSAGGLGLVDDSDRYYLSIVTADPAPVRTLLADPKLATLLGKVHVQIYSPTDWVAKDRLKAAVTLQEPAPKGGKVIWTADKMDLETLAEGLKRADPNWKPEPPPQPKPVDPKPAEPKQPDSPPDTNTPATPAPKTIPVPVLILAGLALLYYFLSGRKVTQ